MSDSAGFVSIVNDGCRTVVVLILNGIFSVCHEILKFSLILFLVYYLGMWIFCFWDAVLNGTLPNASDFLPQIEIVDKEGIQRLELPEDELEEDIKEIEIDFEKFINADLEDSSLSLSTKPRSAQFEHQATIAKSLSDNQYPINVEDNVNAVQEIEETHELEGIISRQSSNNGAQSISEPYNSNPTTEAFDVNVSNNRSDNPFDKMKNIIDAQPIPSYDDQTNHESFHRV